MDEDDLRNHIKEEFEELLFELADLSSEKYNEVIRQNIKENDIVFLKVILEQKIEILKIYLKKFKKGFNVTPEKIKEIFNKLQSWSEKNKLTTKEWLQFKKLDFEEVQIVIPKKINTMTIHNVKNYVDKDNIHTTNLINNV